MNAGAYGKEMKDIVVSTKYMQKDGKIKRKNWEKYNKFVSENSNNNVYLSDSESTASYWSFMPVDAGYADIFDFQNNLFIDDSKTAQRVSNQKKQLNSLVLVLQIAIISF